MDNYSKQNPHIVELFIQLHQIFGQKLGNLMLVGCVEKYLERSIRKLDQINEKTFKQPRIIQGLGISDVNGLLDQAIAAAYLKNLGASNFKPILPLNEEFLQKISGFEPYLSMHFSIVTSDECVREVRSHNIFPLASGTFVSTSETGLAHISDFPIKIFPELQRKKLGTAIFELLPETEVKALEYFKSNGLSLSADIVLVQIEENQANQDIKSDNYDLEREYSEAFKFLLDRNYQIIIIGDQPIKILNSSIQNITGKNYPFEVELFLAAKSKFTMGSDNVLAKLAYCFGTPQLLVNISPFSCRRASAFGCCAPLFWRSNGQKLTINEIEENGLLSVYTEELQKSKRIEKIRLDQISIMDATREMIEYLNLGPIYQLNAKLSHIKSKYGIYGSLYSKSLALF